MRAATVGLTEVVLNVTQSHTAQSVFAAHTEYPVLLSKPLNSCTASSAELSTVYIENNFALQLRNALKSMRDPALWSTEAYNEILGHVTNEN